MQWQGYTWPEGKSEIACGHLTFTKQPDGILWLSASQVAEIEPTLLAAGFEKTDEQPGE